MGASSCPTLSAQAHPARRHAAASPAAASSPSITAARRPVPGHPGVHDAAHPIPSTAAPQLRTSEAAAGATTSRRTARAWGAAGTAWAAAAASWAAGGASKRPWPAGGRGSRAVRPQCPQQGPQVSRGSQAAAVPAGTAGAAAARGCAPRRCRRRRRSRPPCPARVGLGWGGQGRLCMHERRGAVRACVSVDAAQGTPEWTVPHTFVFSEVLLSAVGKSHGPQWPVSGGVPSLTALHPGWAAGMCHWAPPTPTPPRAGPPEAPSSPQRGSMPRPPATTLLPPWSYLVDRPGVARQAAQQQQQRRRRVPARHRLAHSSPHAAGGLRLPQAVAVERRNARTELALGVVCRAGVWVAALRPHSVRRSGGVSRVEGRWTACLPACEAA